MNNCKEVKKLTMNKMANAKIAMILMSLIAIAAVVGVGYLIWFGSSQPSAQETISAVTSAAPSSLTGKPATLAASAVDKGNDDTQVVALLYVISNPTVTADTITGDFSVPSGTTLSSTTSTDVTAGINVGNKYVAIASNASRFGFPTEVMEVKTQSDLLTVPVYSTGTHLQITMKDDADVSITNTSNLTLAANEAAVLSEVKIKLNDSNVGYNFAGFYFNKVVNSNISAIEVAGSGNANGPNGDVVYSKATLGLQNTENDDVMFLFDSPILMKEQSTVTIANGIKITADDSGCNSPKGDGIEFYALDRIWVKSSVDSKKMIYAYESDASSPADIGMTNPSFYFVCTA